MVAGRRQLRRAEREAALGRCTDDSYNNKALDDARQAYEANLNEAQQKTEELEKELVQVKHRRN